MTCPFRLSRSIWGVSLAAVLLLATGCDSTDPAEPVPPGGEPEPAILPVFFNRPA